MGLMLSQLYLETFIEFYNLAKRTQQAGIEFEPLVEIAGFDRLSGWITRPSRRLTNVTGDRWRNESKLNALYNLTNVDWENPNIRHFKGRIPNEDAFIWWNVFIRLSLFTPGDGYSSLRMRAAREPPVLINIDGFKSLKSEMEYIYQSATERRGLYRTWGSPQLMELCQEWRQFLARDWYPPGLNKEMIKILNNIFVFGGDEIPVYLTQNDWNLFVKTEIEWKKDDDEPWRSQFSPWQWDWAWCDVNAKRQYVFMSEIQLTYDYELSELDFSRMARGVFETLLQARNPNPVRSLNYPRGLKYAKSLTHFTYKD